MKKRLAPEPESLDRPGPLDRSQWYNAPVRAKQKFERIHALLGNQARPWVKHGFARLYFNDGTFLWCDEVGAVRTTGGLATRAKFSNQLQ